MSTPQSVPVSGKSIALFLAAAVAACLLVIAITKHAERTAHAVSASAIAEGRSR